MGAALYPVFEGSNDGWPDKYERQVPARALDQLNKFAKTARVKPLMDFYSLTLEQAEAEGFDDNHTALWFDPIDGLRTVRALLANVRTDGRKIEDVDAVREDLEAFEQLLLRADEQNIRWRLVVDA